MSSADHDAIRRSLDESARRISRLRDFLNERAVTRNLARRHLPDMAWNGHLQEGYRALRALEFAATSSTPPEHPPDAEAT